mgnify:CR=1 FL=1
MIKPFTSIQKYFLLLVLKFFLLYPLVHANPFFSNADRNDAPPTPMSSGTGPLWKLQIQFRENLAAVFTDSDSQIKIHTILIAIGISFMYGIAHASGHGHRKTIVFSLFLANKTRWWEPLFAGFLSALIHTGAGAVIILAVSLMRNALTNTAASDVILAWMDGITLCLLILISLILVARTIYKLFHIQQSKNDEQTQAKSKYSIIILASLVPCTGTIMILLFSLYINALTLGIVSLIGIALGQGVIVSAAAYLAWFGREGIFKVLKSKETTFTFFSGILELLSYLFLGFVSFILAQPFLNWLIAHI